MTVALFIRRVKVALFIRRVKVAFQIVSFKGLTSRKASCKISSLGNNLFDNNSTIYNINTIISQFCYSRS